MITTAVCATFEDELIDGIHAADDDYRLALIKPEARGNYGEATRNVAELGDDAAGESYPLKGRTVTRSGPERLIAWAPLQIGPGATVRAAGALIFNATQGGRAVSVHAFPRAVGVTQGTLTIRPKAAVRLLKPA